MPCFAAGGTGDPGPGYCAMRAVKASLRKALPALLAAASLAATLPAFADVLWRQQGASHDRPLPGQAETSAPAKGDIASLALAQALKRGLWTRACGLATNILARQEQDLDALGVFALCQALIARSAEMNHALSRLRQVEASPGYYTTLTQGIAALRKRSIDRAAAALDEVLSMRPDDPLALYFRGELLHAQRRDADAIAAFDAVLKTSPEFAPALSAKARLMAAKDAPKRTLDAAASLSERAALIEPMNLAYWQQTAELRERAGQPARAQAIRLQWLNRPKAGNGSR